MAAARLAQGLRLTLLLAVPLSVLSARGRDVPLEHFEITGSGIGDRVLSGVPIPPFDVDADGDMDLMLSSMPVETEDRRFEWWENPGDIHDGWTLHPMNEVTLEGVGDGVSADLDGDGDADVLVALRNPLGIFWLENDNGNGSHWTRQDFPDAVYGHYHPCAGDINGDGSIDVVCGGGIEGHLLGWWENSGGSAPAWGHRDVETVLSASTSPRLGDLDGDGDLDIAAVVHFAPSEGDDDGVYWWENLNGRGTGWSRRLIDRGYDFPDTLHLVYPVDLDGDADLDLLTRVQVKNSLSERLFWWENDDGDASSWTEHPIANSFYGDYLDTADFDLDGDLDVIGRSYKHLSWYENRLESGSDWAEHLLDASSNSPGIHAVDLDGDGDSDVVGRDWIYSDEPTAMNCWENRTIHRSAWFPESTVVRTDFNGADSVEAADFNRDGWTDVAACAYYDDTVRVWLNTDGIGGLWWQIDVDLDFNGARSVFPTDLDRDGDTDLVGAAYIGDEIRWWENSGDYFPSWTPHVVGTGVNGATDVCAGDLDEDGDIDIVATAKNDNAVFWWRNDGTPADGGWAGGSISTTFDGAYGVALGDLDGDGDLDVAAGASAGNRVTWWSNAPLLAGRVFIEHDIYSPFHDARFVDIADIDGDSDLDVLAAAFDDQAIYWFENDGGAPISWAVHGVAGGYDGARDVQAADFDQDGDMDIVGAAYYDGWLAWFENDNGRGTVWASHYREMAFPDAYAVAVADIDGDSDPDVLGAASGAGDTIAWWPNQGGQVSMETADVGPLYFEDSQTAAVLAIDVKHEGRGEDTAAEFDYIDLEFEGAPGVRLAESAVNDLFKTIAVFHDTGNLKYGPEDDLALWYTTIPVTSGVCRLALADGDPLFEIKPRKDERYFVILTAEDDASAGSRRQVRLAQLRGSNLDVIDRDYGIPLVMEPVEEFTTKFYGLEPSAPMMITSMIRWSSGVRLCWSDRGDHWRYTVLTKPTPDTETWEILPGAWPIDFPVWTDLTVGLDPRRVYRVEAEYVAPTP